MIKKIIFGVILLLVILMVIMVLLMKSLNSQKSSNEKILKGRDSSAKRALIIFQPAITDVTATIANSIATGLNDGGYEVTINHPGDYLQEDISKYSLVIFGSPVYVGQPLKAVTDYMAKIQDYSSSKVILFSTGGDASNENELNVLEESLNSVKAYKKVKFITNNNEKEKNAYDLGKELSNG